MMMMTMTMVTLMDKGYDYIMVMMMTIMAKVLQCNTMTLKMLRKTILIMDVIMLVGSTINVL